MIAYLVLENTRALFVGIPLVLVALLSLVWRLRRQGERGPRIGLLVGLRLIAVLILLWLVSSPVRVIPETERAPRSRVALLVDRSESMSLEADNQSRCRQAIEFLRTQLVPALGASDVKVDAFLFAEEALAASGTDVAHAVPDGKQTNLARAIAQAVTQSREPPLAVVALTDGIATAHKDNAGAVAALVENRVPFFGVGIGEETASRVLSLDHVAAPRVVPSRQEFQISVRLRVTGNTETPPFSLTLFRNGQFAQQMDVSPGSGARVWQESFRVTETSQGFYSYTVQLLPPDDPAVRCPRTDGALAVRIVDEAAIGVLFVQGGLTWDYKFIRMALSDDPAFQLSSLSRVSGEATFMQSDASDPNLVSGFPSTIEQLASYRVVVLSNLRLQDLTPENQGLLAQFCRELGGGVLMIGGASTFDASWQNSRLEKLLAVRFSARSRRPTGGRPFRLRITEPAFRHPVFQISEVADQRGAWEKLPAFSHFAPVDSVKAGARVWAVAETPGRSGSKPVLMASQRYGAGLTAVICLQNLWRWRLAKTSDPQHFDRFWQQLLRYLGEGSREDIVLQIPDQRLQPREKIRVNLQRRPDPRQASDGERQYNFRVTDAETQVIAERALALAPDQSVELSFQVPKTGVYRADVLDHDRAVVAFRSLDIRQVDTEFAHTARNMENLRQWANVSGGEAIRIEDCSSADQLVGQMKASVERPRLRPPVRQPLGINGWVLAVLLGCLCIEWMVRKRWGLV